MFTIFPPLFTLGPASTTLYSTRLCRIVPRPHILYNISTTLYSLQLYSISTVYNLYNTPLVRRSYSVRTSQTCNGRTVLLPN